MERTIVVEPLGEKRFVLDVASVSKEARNPSFSNASNCCTAELKIEKHCSGCGEKVDDKECVQKLAKVGKQMLPISAAALIEVKRQVEEVEEIRIKHICAKEPSGAKLRYEKLFRAKPVKKKDMQYAELAKVMEGKFAVGTGVFNGNEYQLLLYVDNGVIQMRRLIEEGQLYDFDAEEVQTAMGNAKLNEQVIELEKKLIEKKCVDDVDLTQFRDSRPEMLRKLIEDVALHGVVPQPVQSVVAEQRADDEVARLQALLNEG